MGLDVTRCQFRRLDTEAILEFLRLSSEPWVFKAGAGAKLKAKARELDLPEGIVGADYSGGERISFPSKKYPKWPPVGEWSSFSTTHEFLLRWSV